MILSSHLREGNLGGTKGKNRIINLDLKPFRNLSTAIDFLVGCDTIICLLPTSKGGDKNG